jgi:hypothetical protein
MASMTHKRYQAASVLDDRGDIWVLGGTHDSRAADTTEVFQYQSPPRKGRWRKGRPLPADLRDSGISSHCAVRVNKTHIMVAGGFAAAYRFKDPTLDNQGGNNNNNNQGSQTPINLGNAGANPRIQHTKLAPPVKTTPQPAAAPCSDDDINIRSGAIPCSKPCSDDKLNIRSGATPCTPKAPNVGRGKRQAAYEDDLGAIGGGFALKRAWLYDGYYWSELRDMSVIRDRPACSIVSMPDGQVCNYLLMHGWCSAIICKFSHHAPPRW